MYMFLLLFHYKYKIDNLINLIDKTLSNKEQYNNIKNTIEVPLKQVIKNDVILK